MKSILHSLGPHRSYCFLDLCVKRMFSHRHCQCVCFSPSCFQILIIAHFENLRCTRLCSKLFTLNLCGKNYYNLHTRDEKSETLGGLMNFPKVTYLVGGGSKGCQALCQMSLHGLFNFHHNACMHATLHVQSCSALCDPINCSPPGSSLHGILQARILEWVALPSSRGSSPSKDETCTSYVSCTGSWVL